MKGDATQQEGKQWSEVLRDGQATISRFGVKEIRSSDHTHLVVDLLESFGGVG